MSFLLERITRLNVLTPAWTPFKYHQEQKDVWYSSARFKAIYAGRGSGKTAIAKRYSVRMLPIRKKWTNPIYFYGMPTYKQAKRVAWFDIIDLIPKNWLASEPSISDMRIDTVFGSSLYIIGLDKPQRIEGVQWDGGIIDESCDQKPGMFERSVLPALTHKNGWCWRIGVPKRYGIGARDFRKFCDAGHRCEKVEGTEDTIETYTWKSSSVLSPTQLLFYRSYFDPRDYAEQFDASWQTVGGAIFYAFDESTHVRDDIQYCPQLPICVCSDFNVNPMSWCLAHEWGDKVYFFDEIFERNTNTPETLNTLWSKYQDHPSGFKFYGDASSRARKTSATFTDYAYIVNDPRFDKFKKKEVYYGRANPSLVDRFSACNSILKTAEGDIRCYISRKCESLIDDLVSRAYKPESREPDDSGDVGHMSDAFGYFIYRKYPVRMKIYTGDAPQIELASTSVSIG